MRRHHKCLLCFCFVLISISAVAQKLSFNRYKVSVYTGRRAKVIIKGNPLAEEYRIIIKDTYYSKSHMKKWRHSTGLNFAGHYCFAWWGCGSPCQDGAVVDLRTGKVYHSLTASLGFEFKRNSRLVIVNPGETIDSCAFCKPEYWVWDERLKKFKRIR
jgi:hypothetical protein